MDWRIPLFDIDIGEEEIRKVTETLRSGWLSLGPVTKTFEDRFSEYLGVKHAFAVSNGTAALHIAQRAVGVRSGDEVILPSFTFIATANSILYERAKPVFADIVSLQNLNISPDAITEKITQKTKAIIAVHYGGHPCQMDQIMDIAKRNNLYVIEDACHAPGAEYAGKKLGTIGDVGCFSFFANKNMTTGEGGMVVTNNDEMAGRIRLLRSHGMTSLSWDRYQGHSYSYDVVDLGFNYRIGEINSALGLVQLSKLRQNNESRKKITDMYVRNLKKIAEIEIPFRQTDPQSESSYHIFPVILSSDIRRSAVLDGLKKKGIQASIHYPPIHEFSYYKRTFGHVALPMTENAARREVTLPLFPAMTENDVKYVTESIREAICKL